MNRERFGFRRSKLFVPGNRSDLMQKALTTQADCLSFDLEDAVAAGQKEAARATLRSFLDDVRTAKEIVVRVNGLNSGQLLDDLLAVMCAHVDVINLPKVSHREDVIACARFMEQVERQHGLGSRCTIMATIETPSGLANIRQIITASARLSGIQLGLGDLFGAHGIQRTDATSNHVRGVVRLAAATRDLDTFDAAFLAVDDAAGFERDAQQAAAWGYCGKSCIHPSQVAIANRVFTPDATRIEHAREVIREYEKRTAHGDGAFTLHGQLVDRAIYDQAKRLVAAAESTNAMRA